MPFAALGFVAGLIPRWGWFAALGVILATLWGWHAFTVHQARKEGRAEIVARWDAEKLAAVDMAREIETMRRQANQGIADAYRQDAARAAAAASAARADADGLRDILAARDAEEPAARPGTDEAATLRRAFSECAGRLEEVATAALGVLPQARGLQSYTARVCIGQP